MLRSLEYTGIRLDSDITRVEHELMVQSRDQRLEGRGTALIKCVP